MYTRYLDPKNDVAFRKVFGEEKHKRIPIDFLNAVLGLEGDTKIVDLEFLNLKQTPEIDARKESIVDVMVRDQQGIKYIVEMQVAKMEGFEKRAQYYAAKTYCAHFGKGGKYHDLKKVIFLAITDYVVFPKKEGRYKSDHVILDSQSHEHDLRDFSFTFVELPKFNKGLKDLRTIEDKWYYFLKHADESDNIEEIIANHPEIKEAYDVLDRFHWSEEELQRYEKMIMNIADAQAILDAARNEGRNEGKAEGIAEGRSEGLEEGEKKRAMAIAKKMLNRGYPIDEIMEDTGISKEDLEKI